MTEYVAYIFCALFGLWILYAIWTSAKKTFGNLQTDIDGSYNRYTHSHNTNAFNTSHYNFTINVSPSEFKSLLESPVLSNKVKELTDG